MPFVRNTRGCLKGWRQTAWPFTELQAEEGALTGPRQGPPWIKEEIGLGRKPEMTLD